MSIEITSVQWKRIPTEIERRLLAVCESWVGTPYMAGQQAKGIGVDCTQLFGGIMDELFRNEIKTLIPRLPQNSGMHFPKAGFRTSIAIRKQFKSIIVRNEEIEPGDALVTRGTATAGAFARLGHILIAGVRPGTALHAIQTQGVGWTSLQGIPGLLRIYRPLNKEMWV